VIQKSSRLRIKKHKETGAMKAESKRFSLVTSSNLVFREIVFTQASGALHRNGAIAIFIRIFEISNSMASEKEIKRVLLRTKED
jgi:hypothetical protein